MTSSSEADFCCSDCDESFKTASQLLTHFALHVSQIQSNDNNLFSSIKIEDKNDTSICQSDLTYNTSRSNRKFKSNVPDLYPIQTVKKKFKMSKTNKNDQLNFQSHLKNCISTSNDRDKKSQNYELYEYMCLASQNSNMKYENELDDFCPLRYCSVTMDETKQGNIALPEKIGYVKPNSNRPDSQVIKSSKLNFNLSKKKYPCTICLKVFGWSTDLKRHVLTHTGERPFKCNMCDACFTRNFLLQKHKSKAHPNKKVTVKNKINVPNLNPICTNTKVVKTKESRKQDKQKIKRKMFPIKNIQYEDNYFEMNKINCLNLLDKGTLVQ